MKFYDDVKTLKAHGWTGQKFVAVHSDPRSAQLPEGFGETEEEAEEEARLLMAEAGIEDLETGLDIYRCPSTTVRVSYEAHGYVWTDDAMDYVDASAYGFETEKEAVQDAIEEYPEFTHYIGSRGKRAIPNSWR